MAEKGLNDEGILRMVGNRVRQERLNQNLTQERLARLAGMSRIVVHRLENGSGCSLENFLRILRSLGKLDQIELLLPEPGPSPMDIARNRGRLRVEASGGRGRVSGRRNDG
jgi:transcriptional regulator with XRE-family HTH domain